MNERNGYKYKQCKSSLIPKWRVGRKKDSRQLIQDMRLNKSEVSHLTFLPLFLWFNFWQFLSPTTKWIKDYCYYMTPWRVLVPCCFASVTSYFIWATLTCLCPLLLSSADGEPIKLPDNLESLPRADHFPTQRHRWNTNEVCASCSWLLSPTHMWSTG